MQARLRSLTLSALLTVSLLAAGSVPGSGQGNLNAGPDDIRAWRDLKFGLFIHWGPVSLKGVEIGWGRGGERRGRNDKTTGPVPPEIYDNLYREFNPVRFSARDWVALAKSAGMRYMVFTTKHHDGFCNFDSKLTDYKITSPKSPYGRDVVRQLAAACHGGGLKWGIYYSQPDWHHPDYRAANHARYVEYLHGQVRELLSNYGRVDMIFFDGLGGTAADWDAGDLFRMIRGLQPRVVINNRCGLPGDYDTPEQRIGPMQTERPWETCMTIGEQWAWKPEDRIKSLKQCLRVLVKVVGGDGNFLLNVGPMPDGRIEPRQAERLREMGAWLAKYGDSIYGTRGGPFERGDWGAATWRGTRIYLHLLDPSLEMVRLPPIPQKIVASRLLAGGTATVSQLSSGIEIVVSPADRQEIDTILELTLDRPVSESGSGGRRP